MKLGALLLKGFQSRKRGFFQKSHVGSPRISKKSSLKGKVLAGARARVAAIEPMHIVSTVVETNVRVVRATEANTLNALQLIKPDGEIRKSIEGFLRDQRSPHTKRAYGKDLSRFVKFLVSRKANGQIEHIDRNLLIAYKDFLLTEKLQHTTIDRHLATLKSFFRWLSEDGMIEKNYAENIRFLNPKRESTTKAFTDEEVQKVLALPDLFTPSGSLHYAVLMILFYCGLRRSELCELRTSSVGVERGHHFLKLHGKGNSERIVVMTKPVWEALEHYLRMARKKLETDQPLFSPVRNNRTFVKEKPIDTSTVFYIVSKYAKEAGVKHRVSPHSCRATAISNARDHQVPDRAIQEFAGWASPLMITRYDKRKSALEKSAVHSIAYGNEERKLPDVFTITRLLRTSDI